MSQNRGSVELKAVPTFSRTVYFISYVNKFTTAHVYRQDLLSGLSEIPLNGVVF